MPKGHTTTKHIDQPYPGALVARVNRGAHVFLLFRIRTGTNGWSQFKLECRSERRTKALKANWWLGFNGSRLARRRDAMLLADHWPDIYAWAMEVLAEQPIGKGTSP